MTTTPLPVAAIESLLSFWLDAVTTEDAGLDPSADLHGASPTRPLADSLYAVAKGETLVDVPGEAAFSIGARFGIAISLAQLAAPLGDPRPAMRDAIAHAVAQAQGLRAVA